MQESGANFYIPAPVSLSNELVTVWDPELGRTNPSEHKQLKLARSLTRGIVDRDLKPSSNERKYVQVVLFSISSFELGDAGSRTLVISVNSDVQLVGF
jgi:hypothetical protein